MDTKKLYLLFFTTFLLLYLSLNNIYAESIELPDNPKISPKTKACIGCHTLYTPGIVKDWETSRHSKTTPEEAFKKSKFEKRISAEKLTENLYSYAVGCYECHSLNVKSHKDNFDHFGYKVNVIVSPSDCSTCHPVEVSQYSGSKKAHAYGILMNNPVYATMVDTITGFKSLENNSFVSAKPSESTLHETCLGCHGTKVEVKGLKNISTKLGDISFPDLTNWPNQGVGRINPDGSLGSCTACHPRHSYLIEIARKPYTCGQCHLDPDVPAWNVYRESKHGNIYSSKFSEWNFDSVPWVIGEDFKAPTCATCHNGLIISPSGNVIAERTHDFGSRLWVRIFGLIYTHAQPKSGDTTIIKNKDGLPLPVTFGGEQSSDFLIDKNEQKKRFKIMSNICNSCHSSDWINGHFAKLDKTIKETDDMIKTATNLIITVWGKKIEDNKNPFDETIEKMWMRQWLFYANSIRYASAMTGAPDYTSFKNGWWYFDENIQRMRDWIKFKENSEDHD
ncbi:MAG: hydroxylamine oxidase [Nitrospirae bacterium]|nr:hydroxylamine oxidase [Nitrospirota bacterium]